MQINPGDMIAGKYRVERVLGEGGMGFVVQAMHIQLDERVAIKFLLPQALAHEEAVTRFAREARAAVKIKSEHVARVSDVGTLESGAPYMVMEYLEGQDLSAQIRGSGALAPSTAVDYVLQALEAIAEAHAQGIIHRDLKPANLFLTSRADGSACVKVLDFGISKLTVPGGSGSDLGMTRTHAIMGSPLYMSPEQMASTRDVNAQADIWSIGAILYELVTGRVPFQADSMPQLCGMILQEPVVPPKTHRPDLPDGLNEVILHCLQKDRALRFQNVAELAMALVAFGPRSAGRSAERIARVLSAAGLPSMPIAPTSVSVRPATPATTSTTQGAFGQTLTSKARPALWLLGSALLVGAGALLAVVFRAHPVAVRDPASIPLDPATSPIAAAAMPPSPATAMAAAVAAPSIEPTTPKSTPPNPESALAAAPSVALVLAPPAFSAAPSASLPARPTAIAVPKWSASSARHPPTASARPTQNAAAVTPSPPPAAIAPTKPAEVKPTVIDPLQGRH